MPFLRMTDLDLAGKRVLIREDLNVPIRDGEVASDARIRAALPTIEHAVAAGAAVMVLSHLGRPQEGEVDPSLSLAPVAERLAALLGRPVPLCADWMDGDPVPPGEVALAENVRFNRGEKADDDGLARRMAAGYDVFVMDAFGTAHRAQASTHAVARHVRVACAGPLLAAELDALGRALEEPRRPLVAIVGGAKVSTKLKLLETLGEKVDRLIVGGGIANTFIAAAGHGVGSSLHEPDLVAVARGLADAGRARGAEIPVPTDVVVGTGISADAAATVRPVDGVGPDEMILDVGPETAGAWARGLLEAGTIVWNGPVGVFEHDQFGAGTERLARAIAKSPAYTIAGGGDTIAAIDKYGIEDRISYVSTGGGAFLEFLEGRPLPAVEMLEARAAEGPA